MKEKLIAAVCAVVLVSAQTMLWAADKAGDVVTVRGKAIIERGTKQINARVKDALLESDSVATRERSRLKMLFRDDSVLTLGQNSRLSIRKYLYSPENRRAETICELADGRLRAVVGGAGFSVATPTAFAAARGTVFTVSYDAESGTTIISVIEGTVEVRNLNEAVAGFQIVRAGQSTTITSNSPPSEPVAFDVKGSKIETDDRNDLPEVELKSERDFLRDLRDRMERADITPPIEQEPAHAVTKVNLNVQFR